MPRQRPANESEYEENRLRVVALMMEELAAAAGRRSDPDVRRSIGWLRRLAVGRQQAREQTGKPRTLIDLTGQTFENMTVLYRVENDQGGQSRWMCRCTCGNEVTARSWDLRNGCHTSCGCAGPRTARMSNPKNRAAERQIWRNMIGHCHNPNDQSYHHYGGRGITVCDEWRADFMAFFNHVGQRPDPSLSLDRIDNDGNYEPGNVRWATASEQVNNRRCSPKYAERRAAAAAVEGNPE